MEEECCGNCKHWDCDMTYCPEKGETMNELDHCENWEDDNDGKPAVKEEAKKQ